MPRRHWCYFLGNYPDCYSDHTHYRVFTLIDFTTKSALWRKSMFLMIQLWRKKHCGEQETLGIREKSCTFAGDIQK